MTTKSQPVVSLVSPSDGLPEQTPPHEIDEQRHRIYSRLLERFPLSNLHRIDNTNRQIDPVKLGYASCPNTAGQRVAIDELIKEFGEEALLRIPGFIEKKPGKIQLNCGAGLLVPVRNLAGQILGLRWRNPIADPPKGNKWIWLSGGKDHNGQEGPKVECPVHWARLPNSETVIVIEGERKSDICAARLHDKSGIVAIPGVYGWRKGLIEQLTELGCAIVKIGFDSDQWENRDVAMAALRLAAELEESHIEVRFLTWSAQAKGLDDAVLAGVTIEEIAGNDAHKYRQELATKFGLQSNGQKPRDPRTVVNISNNQEDVLNQSFDLIKNHRNIFMKNTKIVSPVTHAAKRDPDNPELGLIEEMGLKVCDSHALATWLAEEAQFVKFAKSKEEGVFVEVPALVPSWLTSRMVAVAGTPGHPGPRRITGILHGPTVNESGDLLNERGYCEIQGEGWYLASPIPDLVVPENPTLEECMQAERRIWKVVRFFEWAGELDYPKWLCCLLSVFLRPQLEFTPFFMIAANAIGAGKSNLSRAISLIARGCEAGEESWPSDERGRDDELKKVFSGATNRGATLMTFDNLGNGEAIESPVVCKFVTSTEFFARALGVNSGEEHGGKNRVVLIGNGNNTRPASDLADRTILIQLLTASENPRSRPMSRLGDIGDIKKYCRVIANRRELVAAALTLCRGFIRNGKCHSLTDVKSWGGFADFVNLPVGIVRWVCGVDPLQDRKQVLEWDSESSALTTLMTCWQRLFSPDEWVAPGLLCKTISLERPNEDEVLGAMRMAVGELGANPQEPRSVGRMLSRHEKEIKEVGGKRLAIARKKNWAGANVYRLEEPASSVGHDPNQPISPICPDLEGPTQGFQGFPGFLQSKRNEETKTEKCSPCMHVVNNMQKTLETPETLGDNPGKRPPLSFQERAALLWPMIPDSGIARPELMKKWAAMGQGEVDRELELAVTDSKRDGLVGDVMWVWPRKTL